MDVIYLALAVLILVVLHCLIVRKFIAGGVCTSKARMDSKTVIITGANTGIGKETALDLAKRGARVIMACRDLKKGEAALKDIVEKTGNANIVVKQLDLASLKSVREFAEDINKNEPELHVLINNAGVFGFSELQRTEDGFEMAMGVNHLGHFLVANLLLDLLKKSSPSRIVVVSALAPAVLNKGIQFDNINSGIGYNRFNAYSQSKLANVLFARELAKQLEGSGVTANSLHPGIIETEIARHLPFWLQLVGKPFVRLFFKTPVQGAQTSIYLAVSEEVEGVSGLYFSDCKPKETFRAANDDGAAKKLWEVSADLVGLNKTT